MKEDCLEIGGVKINCRLFVGTGKFSSHHLMREVLLAAKADVTTVALRRVD
ncbi:MAG: thiazole synthase, partial [Syntrophaceae bacterium]|nr:thiazole synthase [Syntrophaceae bacterium]